MRGVIETLALFRTDIELQGVEVSIPETVLVSQLAAQFRDNPNINQNGENNNSSECLPETKDSEVYVYYPSLYALDLVGIGEISPCQQIVLDQIQELSDFKSQATTRNDHFHLCGDNKQHCVAC